MCNTTIVVIVVMCMCGVGANSVVTVNMRGFLVVGVD